MAPPSPTVPRDLFGGNSNYDEDDPYPPPDNLIAQRSPEAHIDRSPFIPPPEEDDDVLPPPHAMIPSKYLMDAVYAAQSPMVPRTKYRVSA